jgi:hypothetical protein
MKNFIRFCCASLLLLNFASANELLHFLPNVNVPFESALSIQSGTVCSGHSIPLNSTQNVKGSFCLKENAAWPIPIQLILKDVFWKIDDQGNEVFYSLDHPGSSMEMNELTAFRNQPLQILLKERPPFIELSKDISERFKGMAIIKYPILAGFLGEDLYTLFSICSHSAEVGESFHLTVEKDAFYQTDKKLTVKQLTPEKLIVEVNTKIERQRITLACESQAVVHAHSKAIWEIDRTNGLHFHMKEHGKLTQAMRIDGIETTQEFTFDRKVCSGEITLDDGGRSESSWKG